jgi:hypothetical protein
VIYLRIRQVRTHGQAEHLPMDGVDVTDVQVVRQEEITVGWLAVRRRRVVNPSRYRARCQVSGQVVPIADADHV